jgi:hypothetical protein
MLKVDQFFKPTVHQNCKMKGIELIIYFNVGAVKNNVAYRACPERGVAPRLSRLTILAGTFCSHSHTHTHTHTALSGTFEHLFFFVHFQV